MPGALREDAMRIRITRDWRIFFRDHGVLCNDLPDEILKSARDGAEKKFFWPQTHARNMAISKES
jgi:hypothetical protein